MMAVSPAAKDSRDIVRRAEDLNRNQGGSRTEPYWHSCSNATTGACDSEKHRERCMSHCFSTLARPSMSQLRSNAEKTPQEQHEDCMTKYNEILMDKKLRSAYLRTENKKQNVFDSESRSDLSFT